MHLEEPFRSDVETMSRIDVVPVILDVVCRTTGMGFAAVARVTDQRWICCRSLDHLNFGLQAGGESRIETTICNEIRSHGEPVVIDHVAENCVFCGHPSPAMYGFQSYVSFPIRRRNGEFFGTLCAIDPKPARVETPEVMGMFRLFSDLIAFHVEAQERLVANEAALLDAHESAALREQFVAVLGHDLRNPLTSLSTGIRLLRTVQAADAPRVLARMDRSIGRMTELIGNITDFARARLGGGLHLRCSTDRALLEAELQQVIAEVRAAWVDRDVQAHLALAEDVSVDVSRIGQLLSNLLSNALTHGHPDHPVTVGAATRDGVFQVTVTNSGTPITAEERSRLFEPFVRGARRGQEEGLGLGLYIAAEIAKAHGGTIDVESDERETRFSFRLPMPAENET